MIQEKNDVYKETLLILAYFSDDMLEKIPVKLLEKLKEYAAHSNAEFFIDIDKDLDEQEISEESKNLISLIYYSYIADENEKSELLKLWDDNENDYLNKLQETYDLEEIFENRIKSASFSQDSKSYDMSMIEYKKDNFFTKLFRFIKRMIKSDNNK